MQIRAVQNRHLLAKFEIEKAQAAADRDWLRRSYAEALELMEQENQLMAKKSDKLEQSPMLEGECNLLHLLLLHSILEEAELRVLAKE